MGHLDTIVVADAGLPIPTESNRIDLALKAGLPPFLETLQVVLDELQVEKAVIAEELMAVSAPLYLQVKALLGEIPIETVPHAKFKEKTHNARAIVRTGEFTPYANIILVSGVVF
jgi:D-ribose pyranase